MAENKVALVTGASRGIGRAIAERLAADGADLAICARRLENLEETVAAVEALGRRVLPYAVDVSDETAVDGMVADVKKQFGRIDVLVNNAGITKDGLLARMSVADWDQVMDVNLKGAFLFSRAAARLMMKQRCGSIVNIASVVALMGNPGQANYTASKAGLIALTKSSAKELGRRHIRVNAIAPGFIETDMTDSLADGLKDRMRDMIALGSFGKAEDVAAAVSFLAGDQSSYVSGQTLNVCGGMVM